MYIWGLPYTQLFMIFTLCADNSHTVYQVFCQHDSIIMLYGVVVGPTKCKFAQSASDLTTTRTQSIVKTGNVAHMYTYTQNIGLCHCGLGWIGHPTQHEIDSNEHVTVQSTWLTRRSVVVGRNYRHSCQSYQASLEGVTYTYTARYVLYASANDELLGQMWWMKKKNQNFLDW
jgi:hypothetical protein